MREKIERGREGWAQKIHTIQVFTINTHKHICVCVHISSCIKLILQDRDHRDCNQYLSQKMLEQA